MNSSWVVRRAREERICASCDDRIRTTTLYWYMVATGDMYCCDCPPMDHMDSICEDE